MRVVVCYFDDWLIGFLGDTTQTDKRWSEGKRWCDFSCVRRVDSAVSPLLGCKFTVIDRHGANMLATIVAAACSEAPYGYQELRGVHADNIILREELLRVRSENVVLRQQVRHEMHHGRRLEQKQLRASTPLHEFLKANESAAIDAEWAKLVKTESQAFKEAADPLHRGTRPTPLAAMWWRLTRLLFAAKLLPADAAGGKHRGHRQTIARDYIDRFMGSSTVQQPMAALAEATSGGTRCAEVGDGHFLKQFLSRHCTSRYSIDFKDPEADVLMDLTAPNYNLRGVTRGHYHALVVNEVFEHIYQPVKALQTLAELLAPGGLLIMTSPFLINFHANPDDFHRYTASSVRAMLTQVGLRVETLRSLGNWLAVVGYGTGFGADELRHELLEVPDWLEGTTHPHTLSVVSVSRKPLHGVQGS